MTMHYTRCKEACERFYANSGKSSAVARFWAGRIFLRDDVIISGILSPYATILDSSAASPRDILQTVKSSASGPQGRGRLEFAAFIHFQERTLNLQGVWWSYTLWRTEAALQSGRAEAICASGLQIHLLERMMVSLDFGLHSQVTTRTNWKYLRRGLVPHG